MNPRIRVALAGAACVLGSALVFAQAPAVSQGGTARSVDSPVPGAPPSDGYVWMSGHWNFEGGQWKWVAAHWELPPSRSAAWVGGHWVSSGGNWVWVNGAWNVSDAQQSQVGPPQPPGEYPQGVPAPSTPAPNVEIQYPGQYGPGGVAPTVDPTAGSTVYGSVDDSSAYYPVYGYPGYAYPGYGWAGGPLYWGFPAVGFGFGYGPGFHGWRGGSYVRGGRGFVGHSGFAGHGLAGHFGH